MKAISTWVDVFDSNNKICIYDLLNKEQKEILSQAHDMKTLMMLPKDGDEFKVKGCDYCDSWCVGDKRCECGNRRCYLEYTNANSLDDTSVYAYAGCY